MILRVLKGVVPLKQAAFALTLVAGVMGGWTNLAQAVPALAGSVIASVATATYVTSGFMQTETVSSNTLIATVQAVEALSLTTSQSITRPPAAIVTLSHLLTNTGNTTSSYSFSLTSDGPGCGASNYQLSSLRVMRDSANTGVINSNDPGLALGTPGVLTLQPGEIANLLVSANAPSLNAGVACLALTATTALQTQKATNNDVVTLGNNAVLTLTKSASYPGQVIPGTTDITFAITGSSIGAQDVRPAAMAAPVAVPITVNGAPMSLVLIRDLIPAGTTYNANSLQTAAAGALKLYRTVSDGAFTYTQGDGGPNAAEVAIGVPAAVARNGTIAMSFSVRVAALFNGNIVNSAQGFFDDGTGAVQGASNTVVIVSTPATVGLAKAAGTTRLNVDSSGNADGTANVTFSLRVKNYGSLALYGVQIADVMEGTGATQFGTYTAQTVPGANQYTIVAGSLALAPNSGLNVAGAVATINPAFTGQAASPNLVAANAMLPVGAEFTVVFDLRVNTTGRTGQLLNTARASAALAPGATASIFDDSTNGSDPDPSGYGNPGSSSVPTPVTLQAPLLSLTQSASVPRRISPGVYELDYIFKVINNGSSSAPNVRLVDNLNCTFEMDQAGGHIASWTLVGAPTVVDGPLVVAAGFTGSTTCDRAGLSNPDARASLPLAVALSVVDGTQALGPHQSASVQMTVRITEKPAFIGTRVSLTNTAWAAAFQANALAQSAATVLAATSASAQFVLLEPMGTVYNSLTREPISGAIVTFTRSGCLAIPVTPITVDQVFGGLPGDYTFNAQGNMSMTTGANGVYQFYLKPAATPDLCTYSLVVTPPAGSGYIVSQQLPATPGTFTGCGAVTPNSAPPTSSELTSHYSSVQTGISAASNAACNVFNNHLPLDPGSLSGLLLKKEGSKTQVEFGDFLDYALTVTNKTGFPVTGVNFTDTLPAGLAYIKSSARLNGQPSADPVGGAGPGLLFAYPAMVLPVDGSAVVRYRVRIGVGAPTEGDAVNLARAASGTMQSNLASFKTHITGGVFADDAYAFGKVYLDCRRDGMQSGADEVGIPGVRLFLENGTNVITDSEGKWSLYGLKPVTHVLRLDQSTLPSGAVLGVLDNRNSGTPESRFVDLKKGEFHKANFIVTNCANPAMVAEVTARRKALATRVDAQSEARVRLRLDPEGKRVVVGDTRALPASSQALSGGAAGMGAPLSSAASALIQLPTAAAGSGALTGSLPAAGPVGSLASPLTPLTPLATPVPEPVLPALAPVPVASSLATASTPSGTPLSESSSAPADAASSAPLNRAGGLEALMPQLDNQPAFIDLKDGEIVPTQTVNVRLKGEAGNALRLTVNGEVIEERRVGMKAVLESKQLTAWEYIGVTLKAGVNTLQFDSVDSFGNTHATQRIRVTAPDKLGAIQIDLPPVARADLRTPVVITVRLTDVNGVPVTTRTALTLEADRGRWLDTDLNPMEPGTQVFIEGGRAEFHLLPPGEPGDARIRVSSGSFVKEVRLALLPEIRPMLGVGIVEGVLDFTKRGGLSLGQMPAGAAFETELSGLKNESSGARASGRSAFFFKGTVKGDYLLTAAFDSDKTARDRLFRDIRPDEFYPVYGDSAVTGFDAQSTQKLYVRIDKNRSYLLYGDFTTASSAEVRNLSQSNRALTGAKQVYEDKDVRATTYVSRTAQTQQIEEFRAVGTSGPYYLSATGGDLVDNSETIEILVRDRNQPGVVLQHTPVVRFVDYTIEPLTRRILFTHAIASIDPNLNPQSIRVTYEVNSGGPQFTVAGTDVQVKVSDAVQLGVVASLDQNPTNRRKLVAATALARVGEHATVAGELVQTESDLNGKGRGARVEAHYQDDKLTAVAIASKTGTSFDNPGASASIGHTDATARAEYKFDATTALRTEGFYSKDATTGDQRKGASASVREKLSDTLLGELGVRYGQTGNGAVAGSTSGFDYGQVSTYNGVQGGGNGGAASVTSLGTAAAGTSSGTTTTTTVRGRLTAQVPGVAQAQVFVEGEQDIAHAERHVLSAGANYAITDKTRLYGRYELISSLDGPYNLNTNTSHNTGIVGVESNYMEGGRVFNEYRLTDSIDGRSVQAAMGVRNTFKVSDRVRLTAGVEHTQALGATSNSVSTGTGTGTATTGALGSSTAVISGAEYLSDSIKASVVAEARNGSDANTRLLSAGFGYKIDTDWSLLARSVVTDSQGQGANAGNNRRLVRNQLGVALRPVGQDVWNALARYEHKSEYVGGPGTAAGTSVSTLSSATAPGTYSTDIVSANLNVNPARGNYVTARYAGKISRTDDGTLASRYWANLLQGRYTHDLNKDWDLGVQAGLMWGQGGSHQKTLGLEVGYQVARNLWLSAGYNVVGLNDRDLATDYTGKGVYLRLRFKFDENTLGLGAAANADTAQTATATQSASALSSLPPQTAAALAAARPQAAPAWTPGNALPARVVFTESDLFTPGQATLSPAGAVLLDQLGPQLAAQGIGAIEVSARDPEPSADASNLLWLGRTAAVRNVLRTYGPRTITLSTDSQPAAPLPQAAQTESDTAPSVRPSLQIALVGN